MPEKKYFISVAVLYRYLITRLGKFRNPEMKYCWFSQQVATDQKKTIIQGTQGKCLNLHSLSEEGINMSGKWQRLTHPKLKGKEDFDHLRTY